MTPIYRPLTAALWMLGSIFSFLAMGVAGRALKNSLDVFEIMTWRSVIGLCIVLVAARIVRAPMTGPGGLMATDQLPSHLIRNTVHFAGQGLWLWALMSIPLAQLFALEFTAPIWVMLMAPFLLGERLTSVRALAAAIGFTGVLIVARPDFGHPEPGVIAALVSAMCFAVNITMTKRLTGKAAILSILFWQTAMQAVMGLATAGWDGQMTWPSLQDAPWVAIVGIGGLVAHFSLTKALSLAPASVVIPIDFARLPLAAVLGYAMYGEALELAVVLGGALIILGNFINIRYGARTGGVRRVPPGGPAA